MKKAIAIAALLVGSLPPVAHSQNKEPSPPPEVKKTVAAFAGTEPGVGPLEASAVIGYSPDEQVVRWMEISSTGEYHDHRGRWKGTELGFEPLAFVIAGEKATEYLRAGFPADGKLTLNAVTETAGGKSVLERAGRRATSTARP